MGQREWDKGKETTVVQVECGIGVEVKNGEVDHDKLLFLYNYYHPSSFNAPCEEGSASTATTDQRE